MIYSETSINGKLLFRRKKCPKCGNKMRIFYKNIEVSEKERLDVQKRFERCGKPVILNGELKMFKKTAYVKCTSCEMILDDKSFIKVRKLQKLNKRYVLTKSELDRIIEDMNVPSRK